MSIKSVRAYQASDGKMFDSREKAMVYDTSLKVLNGMRLIVGRINVSTMAIDLFNDVKLCEELRDLCNKSLDFHRRYGKLRGVTKQKVPTVVKGSTP